VITFELIDIKDDGIVFVTESDPVYVPVYVSVPQDVKLRLHCVKV